MEVKTPDLRISIAASCTVGETTSTSATGTMNLFASATPVIHMEYTGIAADTNREEAKAAACF